MTVTLKKEWAVVAALAVWSAIAGAQIPPPTVPAYGTSDENGVNFASGSPYFSLWDVSIGSGDSTLTHTLSSAGALMDTFRDSFSAAKYGETNGVRPTQTTFYPGLRLEWGGIGEIFYVTNGDLVNGPFVSLNRIGSTLVRNADGTYDYTQSSGTIIRFGSPLRIIYPDGRVLTVNTGNGHITSVTRNDGLQMKYNYTGTNLTSVVAINNAYEYCDPVADICNLTMSWPTATYSKTGPADAMVLTVTDALGRVTRYTHDAGHRVARIKLPTSSTDNIIYSYCNNSCFVIGTDGGGAGGTFFDMVTDVERDGQHWTYNFLGGHDFSFSQFSSTSPQGLTTQASLVATFAPFTPFVSPILSVGGPKGGVGYDITDPSGRPTGGSFEDGQGQTPTYDARGNVRHMSYNPRTGTGTPARIVTADYDVTCTNPITCNQANFVVDARGKRTDYQYDPVHGGVLKVTGPADANGVRPQTRYSYAQRYAWIKNSSGAFVQATSPIWVRTAEKYCRTSASVATGGCTAAGDEVVITYDYGPNSGPNNLFLRGVATTADGVTLRTCYGRDPRGNMISETKPRAGLASCP